MSQSATQQNATNHILRQYKSHIVGSQHLNLDLVLPEQIRQHNPNGLVIVACKNSDRLAELRAMAIGKQYPFDTEYADTTSVLYTTIGSARVLIQRLIKDKNSRIRTACVMIQGTQQFDANAYGIHLLREAYLGEMSLILLTQTSYNWLGDDAGYAVHRVPAAFVVYEPNIKNLPFIRAPYFSLGAPAGPDRYTVTNPKDVPAEGLGMTVNNTFSGSQQRHWLSQHQVILAEDAVPSTDIYRITTSRFFESLPKEPRPRLGDIRKIIAGFLGYDFKKAYNLIDKKKYAAQIADVQKLYQIGDQALILLRAIGALPLEYDTAYFLTLRYLEILDKEGQPGVTPKSLMGDHYCSCLVGALIDTKPNYGDLTRFAGQDDLETLLNFWEAIMVVTQNKAYNLAAYPNSAQYLKRWCEANKLVFKQVSKLCKKVTSSIAYLTSIAALEEHRSVFMYNQKPKRLRECRESLIVSFQDNIRDAKGLDFSQALPRDEFQRLPRGKEQVVLLKHDQKKVYLFIETNVNLYQPEVQPMMQSASDLFDDEPIEVDM